MSSGQPASTRVDQQLLYAQLLMQTAEKKVRGSSHPLREQAFVQAVILQLALALDAYLEEITPTAISPISLNMLSAGNALSTEFRLCELQELYAREGSWLCTLAAAQQSIHANPGSSSAARQNKPEHIIATSKLTRLPEIDWKALQLQELAELLGAFKTLVHQHRELSQEN